MAKTKGNKITVLNKTFDSLTKACEYYGISLGNARYRLKAGWSVEQVFEIKQKPNNLKRTKIQVGRLQYSSIKEACKDHNLDHRTVSSRLHNGWTVEEAFNVSKKHSFIVNGIEFNYLKRACRKYKLDPCTVTQRINRGWTVEEAFELTQRKSSKKCNGKVYKITNSANSKIYIGITTHDVNSRFSQHLRAARKGSNIKFHKAIRKIGEKNFMVNVIKTTSCKHKLIKLEVGYIKKYNSILKGYNTAIGGSNLGEKHGKLIVYKNIPFISHTALADYLNISRTELWRKLNNNTLR